MASSPNTAITSYSQSIRIFTLKILLFPFHFEITTLYYFTFQSYTSLFSVCSRVFQLISKFGTSWRILKSHSWRLKLIMTFSEVPNKWAGRLWTISSHLADLSFRLPVLLYNDSSSSVIISHHLASLFEIELELNSLDWNVNELEHELELEDMKPTLNGYHILAEDLSFLMRHCLLL